MYKAYHVHLTKKLVFDIRNLYLTPVEAQKHRSFIFCDGVLFPVFTDVRIFRLLVLCGFSLFSLLVAFLLLIWMLAKRQQGLLIVVEWSILVVRVYIEVFFFNLVGLISDFNIKI